MMAAKSSTQGDEGAGMSFAMLCRLISEGRAAEVTQAQGQVEVIDAINVSLHPTRQLRAHVLTSRQPSPHSQPSLPVPNPGRQPDSTSHYRPTSTLRPPGHP